MSGGRWISSLRKGLSWPRTLSTTERRYPRYLTYAIGIVSMALLPPILSGLSLTSAGFAYNVGTQTAIFALALMGMVVLYGRTGQISLAHAGFVGVGAYMTALLRPWTAVVPWGFVVELVVVVLVASLLGLLVGLPAVRVSGLKLAILTLAFAETFAWSLGRFDVFGRTQGLFVGAMEIGGFSTFVPHHRFYLALTLAGAGGAFLIRLGNTNLGRAMLITRDSEFAAISIGVSLSKTKLMAFVISAIYAGIAGWLFAYHIFTVTPGFFTLFDNVYLFVATVIGGKGALLGAWLGSAYLTVVPEVVREVGDGNHFPTVSGLLLIAVVLLSPDGLSGIRQRMRVWKEVAGRHRSSPSGEELHAPLVQEEEATYPSGGARRSREWRDGEVDARDGT